MVHAAVGVSMAAFLTGCASSGDIALSDATKSFLEGSWGVSDESHPSCPRSNDIASSGLVYGNEYIFEFRRTGGTFVFFDRIEFLSVRYRILSAEERDGLVTLRATGPQPNVMRLRLEPPARFKQNLDGRLQAFSSEVTFLKCSGMTANMEAALRNAALDDNR